MSAADSSVGWWFESEGALGFWFWFVVDEDEATGSESAGAAEGFAVSMEGSYSRILSRVLGTFSNCRLYEIIYHARIEIHKIL